MFFLVFILFHITYIMSYYAITFSFYLLLHIHVYYYLLFICYIFLSIILYYLFVIYCLYYYLLFSSVKAAEAPSRKPTARVRILDMLYLRQFKVS